MSDALVVASAVIAVLASAAVAAYCCQRRRHRQEHAALEDWAETQLHPRSLLSYDSLSSITPSDPAKNHYLTFHSHDHGFSLDYPANWRCSQSASPDDSLVAHFSCPENELAFKRLSVAWDDLSWSSISARQFADHVIEHLPTAVRGSQVLGQRPTELGNGMDAHEIVYVITDDDGALIKLLNVVVILGSKALTLTFSVAETEFDAYLPLAYRLINSLAAHAGQGPASAPETSTDAAQVEWMDLRSDALRIVAQRPVSWEQNHVDNRNVLRFTCRRQERYYKSINFFVIDLAAISSGDLLSELVQFYRQEVSKQGSVPVVEQEEEDEGDGAGSGGRRTVVFRSEGRRGLLAVESLAFVGLHGPGNRWGHIVTFTTSADALELYRGLGSHIAASLRYFEPR